MNNTKLIKHIAKYAIRHNCEITLEAKRWKNNSKNFLTDSGSVDTGLELHVVPKENECESD